MTRVLLLTVVDTEKFNHTKEKNLKGNVATQILGTDSQDRVLSYLDFGGGGWGREIKDGFKVIESKVGKAGGEYKKEKLMVRTDRVNGWVGVSMETRVVMENR